MMSQVVVEKMTTRGIQRMEEGDCRDSCLKAESELEVRQERTGDRNSIFAKAPEGERRVQSEM